MTIHEDYLAKVKEAERRHQSLLKELKDEWYKQMTKCPHKNFTRGEQMFYALGETAPGEQCNECGMQRRCN